MEKKRSHMHLLRIKKKELKNACTNFRKRIPSSMYVGGRLVTDIRKRAVGAEKRVDGVRNECKRG